MEKKYNEVMDQLLANVKAGLTIKGAGFHCELILLLTQAKVEMLDKVLQVEQRLKDLK